MDPYQDYEEVEIQAEPEESWFSGITNGFLFLQSNAWYILGIAAVGYYVWNKKLASVYSKWKEEREMANESAAMKKDPELYAAREQARLEKIQKLQEEYNQQAIKMQEIMKAKEEKKREEWIARQVSKDPGRKLNENDFNPLVGNSGPSYRAPRRSACPGGSCNR